MVCLPERGSAAGVQRGVRQARRSGVLLQCSGIPRRRAGRYEPGLRLAGRRRAGHGGDQPRLAAPPPGTGLRTGGARSLLRGYSWTTVCPEELSQKLGGPAARRDGGLPRGLPACCGRSRAAGDQDVEEYSDDAVRRVFEALHPVLPPEMPQFDPAHPELRYFAADASLEPIKDPISGKALVIGVKRALWRPVPSRQPQREVSRRADRGDGPAFRPPPAAQQAAGPGPGRAGG